MASRFIKSTLQAALATFVVFCLAESATAQVILNGRAKTNPPFMVLQKRTWLSGSTCTLSDPTTVVPLHQNASACGLTTQASTTSGNVGAVFPPQSLPVTPLATCVSDACCFKACDTWKTSGGACTRFNPGGLVDRNTTKWLQITGIAGTDSADFGGVVCEARDSDSGTARNISLTANGRTKFYSFVYRYQIDTSSLQLRVTQLFNITDATTGRPTTVTQVGATSLIIQTLSTNNIS